MEHIRIKQWRNNGTRAFESGRSLKALVVVLIWACVGNVGASDERVNVDPLVLLREQVKGLQEALISARIEADILREQLLNKAEDKADLVDGSALVREKEYLILDVNKELGLVILNGGRRDGVKPGLMFDVINGDKSVTAVRVLDARVAISGALVQNGTREWPKVQDRAVVAAGSKN